MTYEPKDIEEIFKDNITNTRDDKTSLNNIDEVSGWTPSHLYDY